MTFVADGFGHAVHLYGLPSGLIVVVLAILAFLGLEIDDWLSRR